MTQNQRPYSIVQAVGVQGPTPLVRLKIRWENGEVTESEFTPDEARTIARRIEKCATFAEGEELSLEDPDVEEITR